MEQAIDDRLTVANENNTNSEKTLENIAEETTESENHCIEKEIGTHVCTSLYSARISSITSEQVVPTHITHNESMIRTAYIIINDTFNITFCSE